MKQNHTPTVRWLVAVVLAHLVVSFVHGWAHGGAQVPLSTAANLFVYIVILAGPLIGAALLWPAERLGIWLIAVTMSASLVFGLINHFIVSSPDHVAHVALQWRTVFATTAVCLAALEGFGAWLAIRAALGRKELKEVLS